MDTEENSITPLQRFFALLKPESRDVYNVYFYAAFNGLLYLSLPLGIQAIINIIMAGQLTSSWVLLVALVIGGVLLTGVLQVIQLRVTEGLQQRIFTKASFEFAYRIPRLKLEAIDKYYVPELLNRFFDTVTVQKGLSKILIDFSTASLQVVFGLMLLSFYHPLFIIFGLILMGMIYLILRFTAPRGLRTSLNESRHKYEVAHWLEEVGRTLVTFKLAGKTTMPLEKTDDLVGAYLKARKSHFKVLVYQLISIVGFKTLVTAGLLIMGSVLVINQQINLGQFVAAEIVILLIMNSVEKIIVTTESIYDVLTALEKIGTVTDLPLDSIEGADLVKNGSKNGLRIEVNNLTYKFPEATRPTLRNINLIIESGERICISGFSNSGKSTLLALLSGAYTDFEGTISYNGIPIGNINLESLRGVIGDSLHQEKLLKGTILENITLGRPGISMDRVIKAAGLVLLDHTVKSMKDGYNTLINPEGKNLSESLISKIILARSLVIESQLVLISDHLDSLEKNELQKIISNLIEQHDPPTMVIISNRPEVAAKCDRIIFMNNGEIFQDDKQLTEQFIKA